MELAINRVGSRVSVDVLHLHLTALYDYMEIPIQGNLVGLRKHLGCHLLAVFIAVFTPSLLEEGYLQRNPIMCH